MKFLYFPDDKTEYIPDIITLIIFMIGASVTLYLIIRHSKKEADKVDKQYHEDMKKDEKDGKDD